MKHGLIVFIFYFFYLNIIYNDRKEVFNRYKLVLQVADAIGVSRYTTKVSATSFSKAHCVENGPKSNSTSVTGGVDTRPALGFRYGIKVTKPQSPPKSTKFVTTQI